MAIIIWRYVWVEVMYGLYQCFKYIKYKYFLYFIENILIPENREWLHVNIVELSKEEAGGQRPLELKDKGSWPI